MLRIITATLAAAMFVSLCGCSLLGLDYDSMESERLEDCDSYRGQEQERCYEAATRTEEEYEHEREQILKTK